MDTSKIVNTLKNALEIMGCDSALISDIDHHSTIELSFNDRSSILCSTTEDVVMLWCILAKYNSQALLNGAAQLIEPLVKNHEWIATGQLQLLENDGDLVLRAILGNDVIEQGDLLADALGQFFDYSETFTQVLR
ncbi:hypothetical protein [Citrobacter sp. U14242]|uniref:InvB/SpaK family type III secretion system chaperone n=1 Tax=Citrobacter sp. U14242 TaxID=3390192 RepID=UPI003979B785